MMAAQENLLLLLTSGGSTVPVGAALDTMKVWILTKAMDGGSDQYAKFIDEISLRITRRKFQTNMSLEIYGSDDEDGPFVLLQSIPVTGSDPLTPDVNAFRFFKFKFNDEGVKERWQLASFEVTGEILGDEF